MFPCGGFRGTQEKQRRGRTNKLAYPIEDAEVAEPLASPLPPRPAYVVDPSPLPTPPPVIPSLLADPCSHARL